MGYVVFFIGIVLAALGYAFDKSLISPKVVFPLYWAILCLLSEFRLFKINEVSGQIYFIVLIGIIFFWLGVSDNFILKSINRPDYKINNKITNLLFWILLISMVPLAFTVMTLIISGIDFSIIRYSYMDRVYGNNIVNIIYKFIVFPLVFSYLTAMFSKVIVLRKMIFSDAVKALVLILLEYFIVGDRSTIFFSITGLIVAAYYSRNNLSLTVKKRIKNTLIFSIFLFFIVIIIRGNTICSSIYTYLVGCFNFFDNRFPTIKNNTYGISSFQGFFRPFDGILELLGIKWKLFDDATDFMMNLQENAIYLNGSNYLFNYFSTCFIWFFKDLKWIGIGLFSFLYGKFSGQSYKLMIKKFNVRYVGIYLFIFYSMLLSMMEFSFVRSEFVWGLIYFLLLFTKRSN